MSMIDSESEIRALREDLRRIDPPYLLRKYEATEQDYEAVTDEDTRCEYMDGVLIVHSPASFIHERRLVFLTTLLNTYAESKQLGVVLGSNLVMQLGQRRFCPDLSFLAAGHENRIRGARVVGPMDLVIEMISTSTREYDLNEKRVKYREGRVPEIWLLDPEEKRFRRDVLRGAAYEEAELTAGWLESRVVPGFRIDLSWLVADPLPRASDCLTQLPG